ncbi:MAG TPA: M20/M25/M40 family metallo-hydrolase [Gaiellaceae bacterium]|nr:M20/M25/M40 family metallo-hydrolase [Gaiellaceae bacterium]
MSLTQHEHAVAERIAAREVELIALVSDLIGFDTTARAAPGEAARDERALQTYLARRLVSAGAECDVWEPGPEDVAGTRIAPDGLSFDGRPQLAATFRGAGSGPSLLLNGHVDVVSPEPREGWTTDPFRADLRDGLLYGRGACDMKGGVGCMVFAAEVLSELGVRLAGDLVVRTGDGRGVDGRRRSGSRRTSSRSSGRCARGPVGGGRAHAPVVSTLLGAASDTGLASRIAGLDNWHDGATFTRLGRTPCVAFGPHGLKHARTVDEHVATKSLVGCAQAVAVAAMRFLRRGLAVGKRGA